MSYNILKPSVFGKFNEGGPLISFLGGGRLQMALIRLCLYNTNRAYLLRLL